MPPETRETWTTKALLDWMTGYFQRRGLDAPRMSAEMLLGHVLDCERLRLYMDADRPASEAERAELRDLIERAATREPIQYLVGEAWFFSLRFKVTPDVLIPRPATATLVEHVLQHQRIVHGFEAPTIVDIGTGSGIIAVSLAKQIKRAHVIATDVSAAALDVARENAESHKVHDRIEFIEGSLYDALEPTRHAGRIDYLVSNPPYVADEEWDDLESNVADYEPEHALRGGPGGLDFLRPLIEQVHTWIRPGGRFAFEIGAPKKKDVLKLAQANDALVDVEVHADFEGFPRVLVGGRRED